MQRWHSHYGLPVRHVGGDTGSIFAFPDELDRWMRNRENHGSHDSQSFAATSSSLRPLELPHEPAPSPVYLTESYDKARSSELVDRATRMWAVLSSSNVCSIARLYRDAIELGPGNAQALTGLAYSMMVAAMIGRIRAASAYPSAEAALRRALEIDGELPEARTAKACLDMIAKRNGQDARPGFDRLLDDCPSGTPALVASALLKVAAGSLQEAAALMLMVVHQHPLVCPAKEVYCWVLYLAGEHDKALAVIGHARSSGQSGNLLDAVEALASIQHEEAPVHVARIERLAAAAPSNCVLQGVLGLAYGRIGKMQEARGILDSLVSPEMREKCDCAYPTALALLGLDQKEAALEWLEDSYREGSLWSFGFNSDPAISSLRSLWRYGLLQLR